MRDRLLVFSGFADNAQSVLTTVQEDAFMSIEGRRDFDLCIGQSGQIGPELRIAAFADAKERRGRFDDAETTLRHNSSLPLLRTPVDFKRHHYRGLTGCA